MNGLKQKLYAAASIDAGLQAVIGSNPFRWFDVQIQQNQAVTFPLVVVQVVSNPRKYVANGRLPTSWARVQFKCYGVTSDDNEAVVDALTSFMDGYNGAGLSGLPANANYIIGDRDGGVAQTDPETLIRIVDVSVYDNERVA